MPRLREGHPERKRLVFDLRVGPGAVAAMIPIPAMRVDQAVVEAARRVLAQVLWAERSRSLNLPSEVCDALQTLRECCEDHSRNRLRVGADGKSAPGILKREMNHFHALMREAKAMDGRDP